MHHLRELHPRALPVQRVESEPEEGVRDLQIMQTDACPSTRSIAYILPVAYLSPSASFFTTMFCARQ